jgi:hypothetical protein
MSLCPFDDTADFGRIKKERFHYFSCLNPQEIEPSVLFQLQTTICGRVYTSDKILTLIAGIFQIPASISNNYWCRPN